MGRGTTILDRHCGRSFSFALLQSEIYKKEMLSPVYSKEAPDGGKTKGTSHYPPWGTCTLKLYFFALLLILSTCSPLECPVLSPAPFSLAQSFTFSFLSSFPLFLAIFLLLNFACLLPRSRSHLLVFFSYLPLSPFPASSFSPSLYACLSPATCWLAQSKTLY